MVLPSTVCERPPWYVCTTLHDTADPPRLLVLVNSHSCQQTHITGHGMRVLHYTHPPQAAGAGQLIQLVNRHTPLGMVCVYRVTPTLPPNHHLPPSCWCWSANTAVTRNPVPVPKCIGTAKYLITRTDHERKDYLELNNDSNTTLCFNFFLSLKHLSVNCD